MMIYIIKKEKIYIYNMIVINIQIKKLIISNYFKCNENIYLYMHI